MKKTQRKRVSPVMKWRLASDRKWKCGICDKLLGDDAEVDEQMSKVMDQGDLAQVKSRDDKGGAARELLLEDGFMVQVSLALIT